MSKQRTHPACPHKLSTHSPPTDWCPSTHCTQVSLKSHSSHRGSAHSCFKHEPHTNRNPAAHSRHLPLEPQEVHDTSAHTLAAQTPPARLKSFLHSTHAPSASANRQLFPGLPLKTHSELNRVKGGWQVSHTSDVPHLEQNATWHSSPALHCPAERKKPAAQRVHKVPSHERQVELTQKSDTLG